MRLLCTAGTRTRARLASSHNLFCIILLAQQTKVPYLRRTRTVIARSGCIDSSLSRLHGKGSRMLYVCKIQFSELLIVCETPCKIARRAPTSFLWCRHS